MCIDNPLIVKGKKKDIKRIVLTTNNGTIKVDSYFKSSEHYDLNPDRPGNAIVYISRKESPNKPFDSIQFEVRRLPVRPSFASLNGGRIQKSQAVAQIGLAVHVVNANINAGMPVKAFTIQIIRNGKEIFLKRLMSMYLDKETKIFLKQLSNGDSVIFKDIIVSDCDGSDRHVQSLEVVMIKAEEYIESEEDRPKDGDEVIDPITGETYMYKEEK